MFVIFLSESSLEWRKGKLHKSFFFAKLSCQQKQNEEVIMKERQKEIEKEIDRQIERERERERERQGQKGKEREREMTFFFTADFGNILKFTLINNQ